MSSYRNSSLRNSYDKLRNSYDELREELKKVIEDSKNKIEEIENLKKQLKYHQNDNNKNVKLLHFDVLCARRRIRYELPKSFQKFEIYIKKNKSIQFLKTYIENIYIENISNTSEPKIFTFNHMIDYYGIKELYAFDQDSYFTFPVPPFIPPDLHHEYVEKFLTSDFFVESLYSDYVELLKKDKDYVELLKKDKDYIKFLKDDKNQVPILKEQPKPPSTSKPIPSPREKRITTNKLTKKKLKSQIDAIDIRLKFVENQLK